MDLNNYINVDDCSIVIEPIGRRAYSNSEYGREELRKDCEKYNTPELYNEVLSVWGETPTIVEVDEEEVKTLDDLKEDKLTELEDQFSSTVKGSFVTTEGYKMQFDIDDTIKMFGAIQVMEDLGVDTSYITDADDVTHYDIPLATMKSVQSQMLRKYAECHLKKQQYRASINEAETIEDLNAIDLQF